MKKPIYTAGQITGGKKRIVIRSRRDSDTVQRRSVPDVVKDSCPLRLYVEGDLLPDRNLTSFCRKTERRYYARVETCWC